VGDCISRLIRWREGFLSWCHAGGPVCFGRCDRGLLLSNLGEELKKTSVLEVFVVERGGNYRCRKDCLRCTRKRKIAEDKV
jgi:hypothetical protein